MVFIHQSACTSPQVSLLNNDTASIQESVHNVLHIIEPKYEGIPLGVLRRMGKAVRMGIGAAMPLLKTHTKPLNGIVIGTANGGMEDCIKFLNQVIEFKEGTLTPTSFVQSTTNAIASQIGLFSVNKGYNITHVNRGFSFENALLDVMMLLNEHPSHAYLLGGVEEISTYNYNIDYLAGSYKEEIISNLALYDTQTPGTIAGEGVAMFVVDSEMNGALASVDAIKLLPIDRVDELVVQLQAFLVEYLAEGETIDVLLTGENGDVRSKPFYNAVEQVVKDTAIARYKHLTGEFAAASSISLYIACQVLEMQSIPSHMLKSTLVEKNINKILIYNNHKGVQHSFMLVSKV